MKSISAADVGLNFGPGKDYCGPDLFFGSTCSSPRNDYDFLIFTDSRGTACNTRPCDPWANRIACYLDGMGYSVLLVCRPKVMTVFFTLIYFLRLNHIKYKYLISNLGFVDFTPKKRSYLEDISIQALNDLPVLNLPVDKFSVFTLASGESENLFAYNFRPLSYRIAKELVRFFDAVLLIDTVEVSAHDGWPRLRPREFYEQIRATNDCLKEISISDARIKLISPFSESGPSPTHFLYDAVHYTPTGHDRVFSGLRDVIDADIRPKA